MAMVPKYTSRASVPGSTGMQPVSLSLATSPLEGVGEGITQVAGQLEAAAGRVQKREDVISRGRDEGAFKTAVSTEWQRVQDQEDLTDRKTFGTFNAFVNQQKANLLLNHRGSANSSTLLDAGLTDLAGRYERSAISATREAQVSSLSKQFGNEGNQIIAQVASGAMDTDTAFVEITKFAVGDDTVGGALPTNVRLDLVDALQSQIIITKIESDLSRGDEAGIAAAKATLDQNPSFNEILSPTQLGSIMKRIGDRETAIRMADIAIAKGRQKFAGDMGYSNYAAVPPAMKVFYASNGKIAPPKPYTFQSDAGKQSQDRQQLVAMAGGNQNAATVKAFDESIAQSNKTAASSKVGKLIQDLDNLAKQNVSKNDPRVQAIQTEINNENPEYVAEEDRIQKFVPAVAAFETFNRQALSLEKDAKKALMLLTGEKTFLDAEKAAVQKSFSTYTSGSLSALMQFTPGSDRNELDAILTRIGGKAMLDALSELKAASPTGASGMGALNETEGNALRFQEGALDANAPQTTSATLIDLIKNTNSVINSQLDAFKAAFPTRGEDITANLVGSTSGNRKRYTKEELEKLRRNKFTTKKKQ
tara:strand:- start:603 stop:2375 length:1773 start_codon:yes stop_codon:yes gene_type:complete